MSTSGPRTQTRRSDAADQELTGALHVETQHSASQPKPGQSVEHCTRDLQRFLRMFCSFSEFLLRGSMPTRGSQRRLLVADARTECTGSLIRARLGVCTVEMTAFRMCRALLGLRIRDGQQRAREQVQRVADPSSQPPASRRSIGDWWPDEGSALEMAYSDGTRSHSKGHA